MTVPKIIAFLNLILFSLLLPYPEFFQDYNKPHEKWFKSETNHFRVYFLAGLKEQAELAASIAEDVYESITKYYELQFLDKIDLIVYDEDYSNGWAWASRNTMKIWVADIDFALRGSHHWLRDVVTHEFSHLVSIQAGQKTRYNIPDIRFGYFDYYNENVQTSFFTVYSFEIFPPWFAEGIAQNESARKGYDSWDAHRDMIMRTKTLNNNLLPLAQMNFFIGKGIEYESGPYNQGFSMVRYIEKIHGKKALKKICDASEKLTNPTFNMAVKSALGLSLNDLYDNWADHEKKKYKIQKEKLDAIVEGNRLVKDSSVVTGYRNLYPRWGIDDQKVFFLSNGPADGGRAFLSIYDFCDTIKKEKERYRMHYPGVSRYFSLSDSDKFVTSHISYPNPLTGDIFTDVYTDSITKHRFLDNLKLKYFPDKKENGKKVSKVTKLVTYQDHIMHTCISHNGSRIAGVQKLENKNCLLLMDNKNINESRNVNILLSRLLYYSIPKIFRKNSQKVIYKTGFEKKEGLSIYSPRFSPNDSLVVFSYYDSKSRNIGMVDTNGHFTALLTSSCDERDPDFTPDGKSIVFSSNRTGIFNIYRMDLETRQVEQITNVVGGAFCPAVSYKGDRIAYTNFDTSGFTIYVTGNNPVKGEAYVRDTARAYKPLGVTMNFGANIKKYFPIFNRILISPMIIGEEMIAHEMDALEGKFGIKAGGVFWLTDPLEKNSLFILGLMEIDKGIKWIDPSAGRHLFFNPEYDKEFMILYENRSFYPTLSFEVDKFLIHEDDLFYNNTSEKYEKDNYIIDVQRYQAVARMQFFSALRKLHFGLTYSKHNVDFYNLMDRFAFEYTFFKELNPTVFLTHLRMGGAKGIWRQEDLIDTRGTYVKIKYDYLIDSILVDGASWQESFEMNSNGSISPKYDPKDTAHHRLRLDIRHARPMPFLPLLTVGGETQISVANRPINNFVYPGVFMKTYPFLSDQAHLTFQGRNTGRAEAYIRFPILRRLRKNIGIFLFDKIYGMAFLEAGASAGIDPREAGREDLDEYSRMGRDTIKFMMRMETHVDSARTRRSFSSKEEMEDTIAAYEAGRTGFTFDERDKHVIYESLPDDSAMGFVNNLTMLWDAPKRLGFGLELRFENYIIPGYPFFITLRYSHQIDQDDIGGSFKNYFTMNPAKNRNAVLYFNIGFSFDNWEYIDIPDYHNPRKRSKLFR